MYYAVYDLQTGCYLESGFNRTDKNEVKEDLLSMFAYDIPPEDLEIYESMALEDMCEQMELRVDSKKFKFKANKYDNK